MQDVSFICIFMHAHTHLSYDTISQDVAFVSQPCCAQDRLCAVLQAYVICAVLQAYVICELHEKVNVLWSFIKTHLRSKVIVFLSTCKQVKFMYEAFKKLRPGVPLRSLHGKMKQFKRMAVFYDFCEVQQSMTCIVFQRYSWLKSVTEYLA